MDTRSMNRPDDGDYAAWQAHQEMDRVPDPSLNPCEHLEAQNDALKDALRAIVNDAWCCADGNYLVDAQFIENAETLV